MIYELRQYTPQPGKANALRARFLDRTMPIFDRLGIRVVTVFGQCEPEGDLWYIVAFDTELRRRAAWATFAKDKAWQLAKTESELEGPLLLSHQTFLLSQLYPKVQW